VTTPATPTLLGELDTPGFPSAVAYADHKVYLGESTNGGALRIIDVTDPAHPAELGAIATTKAADIDVRGTTVFVGDQSLADPGGLRIFDVHDPAHITKLGEYTECGEVSDVALEGDVAALACEYDGFHFVDISDLAHPVKLGSWTPPEPDAAAAIALEGTRAYLGTSSGVVVASIADPHTPVPGDAHPVAFPIRSIAVPAPGRVVAACGPGGVYQWQLP
jgi:hypothetical protein